MCKFKYPDKCNNPGSNAYAITIMNNANVPIPREAQLTHQGHKSEVSAHPYGRTNDIAKARLQDGLCDMSISIIVCSLNSQYKNKQKPSIPSTSTNNDSKPISTTNPPSIPLTSTLTPQPASLIEIPEVTPGNYLRSHIQTRETKIITLQQKLDENQKECIALKTDIVSKHVVFEEIKIKVENKHTSYKHKIEEISEELTSENERTSYKRKIEDMSKELTSVYELVTKLQNKNKEYERKIDDEEQRQKAEALHIQKERDNTEKGEKQLEIFARMVREY